jgi:NADP-dependent 3-hydroxy acid dehydrogenase YdfG
MPPVDDPVFLVTGASGGIGAATARLAAGSPCADRFGGRKGDRARQHLFGDQVGGHRTGAVDPGGAVGSGVHVTVVQPGLVDAGPIPPSRWNDPKLEPADVARAVLFAVGQPVGVDVSEIVVRPTGQHPAR